MSNLMFILPGGEWSLNVPSIRVFLYKDEKGIDKDPNHFFSILWWTCEEFVSESSLASTKSTVTSSNKCKCNESLTL